MWSYAFSDNCISKMSLRTSPTSNLSRDPRKDYFFSSPLLHKTRHLLFYTIPLAQKISKKFYMIFTVKNWQFSNTIALEKFSPFIPRFARLEALIVTTGRPKTWTIFKNRQTSPCYRRWSFLFAHFFQQQNQSKK